MLSSAVLFLLGASLAAAGIVKRSPVIERPLCSAGGDNFHYEERPANLFDPATADLIQTIPAIKNKDQCAAECYFCGFCIYAFYNADTANCELYRDNSQGECTATKDNRTKQLESKARKSMLACIFCQKADGRFFWSG